MASQAAGAKFDDKLKTIEFNNGDYWRESFLQVPPQPSILAPVHLVFGSPEWTAADQDPGCSDHAYLTCCRMIIQALSRRSSMHSRRRCFKQAGKPQDPPWLEIVPLRDRVNWNHPLNQGQHVRPRGAPFPPANHAS